ncbi:MAG: 7-carboxy-7-deazaguanine synthase QueE [Acidimicrobiales bacterium]
MSELVIGQDELAVAEIFGPTFQGEGPSIGQRAGFVRLGRCNLTCTWCDTPYTWDWERFDPAKEVTPMGVSSVLDRLDSMDPRLVVITGGEPLLQQRKLLGVLEGCRKRGFLVEVETNGTLVASPEFLDLVNQFNVSPKLANSGVSEDKRIVPEALESFSSSGKAIFKFVVEDHAELEEVQSIVDRFDLYRVWIMPQARTPEALNMRLRDLAEPVLQRGWNLSSRMHVELWDDQRGR